MSLVLLLTLGLATQSQGTGADVSPRQPTLLSLAYVLGQAHALRQRCATEDQTWRARMRRLLEVEAPAEADSEALRARFNAGFSDASSRFPRCDARLNTEASRVAGEGRRLATALSAGP